jgi:glycosyltransferase involved in cell wall biosynthesis
MPLRICYVLSQFAPRESGAERQARLQGAELVRRGHVVRVITKAMPGLPEDEVVEGIQVHRWIRTSNRGPMFGLSFVAGVIQALRRLRGSYDLIHTHQGLWEAIAVGMARPVLGRVPSLIQPASAGYYGEAEELVRTKGSPVLRWLALRNTAFAAISREIERQWLELGVPGERMIRTASGVDLSVFHPAGDRLETIPDLPPAPRAIFTGRLHPQKNLSLLLEVWRRLGRGEAPALLLVGSGPDLEPLRRSVIQAGLADRVIFTGAVENVAPWLRSADLFLLPSVAEGMSNSLLEAMATGLPCFVSRIGGNVDLVEDQRTGRLLDPHDATAWLEAIRQGLAEPDRMRALGHEAHRMVVASYGIPAVVDRYVTIYEDLIAERWPRSSKRSVS